MESQCFCLHPKCICLLMSNITQSQMQPLMNFCRSVNEMETLLIVLFALAVIANLINVTVLSYLHLNGQQRTATPTRGYLLSLAVSHALVVILGIARLALPSESETFNNWAFFLLYDETLFLALNLCGIILILGLSVDRYIAVCQPHQYVSTESYERMKIFIAVAYILPGLLYMPHFFYEVPQHVTGDVWTLKTHTSLQKLLWNIWVITVQLVHDVIPCLLIVGFNVKILCSVVRLGRTRDTMLSSTRALAGNRKEKRIVYLLLALTLNFLVTCIPGALFRGVYTWLGDFCYFNPEHETVMKVCLSLEIAGFTSDSVLYFAMDREYRDTFCYLVNSLIRRVKAQEAASGTS
ncbi:probable G-protein coupled receptor B0563.6 [Palaemon carinicauda]|uniref:probable G-protein coupled receptor B0563.6 n=1 Tax=Palaemon carinicauda TaxID=392227 RepID=UPI0035B65CFD